MSATLNEHQRHVRAKLAALRRHHPDNHEAADDLAREFKISAAERYIQRVVSEAPIPTEDDLERLRSLLGFNSRH